MASADFWVKAGDYGPTVLVSGTVYGANGAPLNLTGGSVKFIIRRADRTRAPVSRTGSVTSASTGQVAYAFVAADTAEPGDFRCEWQCTLADGSVVTCPNDGSLVLHVEPQLGS